MDLITAVDFIKEKLFHDLLEDTDTTYEEILQLTDFEVATAVKLLTKEKRYIMQKYIERIKQNNIARMVKLKHI